MPGGSAQEGFLSLATEATEAQFPKKLVSGILSPDISCSRKKTSQDFFVVQTVILSHSVVVVVGYLKAEKCVPCFIPPAAGVIHLCSGTCTHTYVSCTFILWRNPLNDTRVHISFLYIKSLARPLLPSFPFLSGNHSLLCLARRAYASHTHQECARHLVHSRMLQGEQRNQGTKNLISVLKMQVVPP